MDPELAHEIRSTHMRIVTSKKDLDNIREDVEAILFARKCTKVLGGQAYKVCLDKACADCTLLKLDASKEEVTLLKRISKDTHPIFKHLLAKYVDDVLFLPKYEQEPETRILLTTYVRGPTLQRLAPRMSKKALIFTLILVFLTLDHFHATKNILHMDLKGDNIVMGPWPFGKEIVLDIDDKCITIPEMPYVPVMIDFGNATDGKLFATDVYDSGQWKGNCYFPGFDILRLLKSLPHNFLKDIGLSNVQFDPEYTMLKSAECLRLQDKFPTYRSILDYEPFQSFVSCK